MSSLSGFIIALALVGALALQGSANTPLHSSRTRVSQHEHGHHGQPTVPSELVVELHSSNASVDLGAYFSLPGSPFLNDEPFRMGADYYLYGSAQSTVVSAATASIFFVKAGLLVSFVFAMMFFYGQTHEAIAEQTGMKLAHVCCMVYAFLSVSIDLSIKNAAQAYGGSFPFNPACGVVVVEYCKLIVSATLFALHLRDLKIIGGSPQLPTMKDIGWLAIPAAIYAANNLIVFQAIRSTPLSTFGVIRETMLVWNALIWTITFKQPISAGRWLAIGGIFFGCSMGQISAMLTDDFSPGVLWACLLALSNAAGAVANEYAMKQKAQIDINLQNSILYFLCGSFVLMGMGIVNSPSVQSMETFFTGFVPECWTVIILQTFTGLAVSRILKYVEAVTKTIVAAVRGPGVIFIGAMVFHTQLHASEVAATLVVCASCWFYLRQGPLTVAPAAENISKK